MISELAILLSVFALLSFPVAHLCNIQLYQAIKGFKDSYDALIELLESIEHRLDIYTKISPTVAMTEMLVELLSTLALATKEVRQGKPSESVFTVVSYYILSNTAGHRGICQEAVQRERHRGGYPKAKPTHPGRSEIDRCTNP